MQSEPIRILLVEGDPEREHLLETVIASCGQPAAVHRAPGPQHAIPYLSGERGYANRRRYPMPTIILIDFDHPGGAALELLAWLKERRLRIPVVILSATMEPLDRKRAEELGAHSVLLRPIAPADLCSVIRELNPA